MRAQDITSFDFLNESALDRSGQPMYQRQEVYMLTHDGREVAFYKLKDLKRAEQDAQEMQRKLGGEVHLRKVMRETDLNEDSQRYVLYFNGKPVAFYPTEEEAQRQGQAIAQRVPDTEVEVKQEVCTLTPVELNENLRKWFKEKWVRFNPQGKIMGPCARGSDKEGKPKCLPQSKAHSLGKKGRASAAAKKRREDPNPERRGAAKNVATKVREETQDDRNARIIAGEIEDAMAAGNDALAKQKIQELIRLGYTLDRDGNIQPMGMYEEQDACYRKVKARYKVWPSAYASGALVQCRKKGAANWGNKSKK